MVFTKERNLSVLLLKRMDPFHVGPLLSLSVEKWKEINN